MLKYGGITKKSQSIFKGFGYYMMIWALRDDGLIKLNGYTKDREKIWSLTERGLAVAKNLKKIKELNEEIEEIMNA
jgi:DNA-binding PadR family transcriptional regulator